MKSSFAHLKGQARQALLGKYGTVIFSSFLITMILYGFSLLTAFVNPYGNRSGFSGLVYFACTIIVTMLQTVLSAGSNFLYLNIARKRPYGINDIFYCFSNHPDKIIVISLLIYLLMMTCLVPCILVTIIFAYSEYTNQHLPVWEILILLAVVLASLILLIRMILNYSMVLYLYIDHPEKSSQELMCESRHLMKGSRLRLFRLLLSFLGYLLLGLLSFGIGMLWIYPYMNTTITYFYLDLISENY